MAAPFQMSPEDKSLLEECLKVLERWEPPHKVWRKKANHHFALYSNYSDWRREWQSSNPKGKDDLRRSAREQWGAELFIPWCFSIIETVLPRLLSANPRMLVSPASSQTPEDNAENMRYLIDRQQSEMDYILTLQEVVKNGLIYGLGVQKVWWRTEYGQRSHLVPSEQPASDRETAFAQATYEAKVYDDPDAASVDPFDFIYDPYSGSRLRDLDGVFHRNWRSNRYIKEQVDSGRWRNMEGFNFDSDSSGVKFDEIQRKRLEATGLASPSANKANLGIHEVLEYHSREKVVLILDRERIVASGPNPYWHGQFPFQIYRPTPIPGRIAGRGEIEPIEDLQEEINLMRSQRRDNATLVLNKIFAYADGQVDLDALTDWAPGTAIPINGDPKDSLFPIPIGDIPASGYAEEDRLNNDFERTTGISEQITGGGDGNTTATGAQIVEAAANQRIKLKAKRAETELAKPACAQISALNQQKILTNREVRIPNPPQPGQTAEQRWSWRPLGPEELAGQFLFECEGGSMEPPNEALDIQKADSLMALKDNPNVDQQVLIQEVVKLHHVRQPERFMRPPEPRVPPVVLDIITEQLVQNGASQDQAKALVGQSLAAALQQEQRGPSGAPADPAEPPAQVPPPPPPPAQDEPEPTGAPA